MFIQDETGDPVWDRRFTVIRVWFPYFMLAVSLGLSLDPRINRPASGHTVLLIVALTVAVALWTYVMDTRQPVWDGHLRAKVGYFAVRWAITGALVYLNPWFGVFAFVGYIDSRRFSKPSYSFAGVVATAPLTAASNLGGFPKWSVGPVAAYVVITAFYIVLAGCFGLLARLGDVKSANRKLELDELGEANRKLQESLQENAGLHAQLVVQAREAGVLDERARMAREIHDTLAQGLTGIITQLEAAEQARGEPDQARSHLDLASRLARQSLTEARRSVQALRPRPLEVASLTDAVREMAQEWSATSRLPVSVESTGEERPLLPEIENALFRVAQEALGNVAAHAGARKVGVTLTYLDDLLLLDVRDDGIGFDPERPDPRPGRGFGLVTMRQRVQRVAGRLEIESAPGEGTALSAAVPAISAEAPEPEQPALERHLAPTAAAELSR